MVRQKMVRVNIDILGISEIKWVHLIQMIILSTTVGKNTLEEMEYPLIINKESETQYFAAISKMKESKKQTTTKTAVHKHCKSERTCQKKAVR